MSATDTKVIGLSPRARRVVVPAAIAAAAIIAVGAVATRGSGDGAAPGPVVGEDLHAVAAFGDRTYVGGHNGAAVRDGNEEWRQVTTLDDKDVMGWAATDDLVLAAGHAGLYASVDNGDTFRSVAGVPASDIHAVGSSGRSVYVASPEVGVLVSTDDGASFELASAQGMDFMGSIWVDQADTRHAIAPSMQSGVMVTVDGGETWSTLGGPAGTMSVAVDDRANQLLAVSMTGAQESTDGGTTWRPVEVPAGTLAASYTHTGALMVAALDGDDAKVFRRVDDRWELLT